MSIISVLTVIVMITPAAHMAAEAHLQPEQRLLVLLRGMVEAVDIRGRGELSPFPL